MSPRHSATRLAVTLCLALTTTAHAQTTLSVRVRVTDTSGMAIPSATVSVLSASRQLIAAGATDTLGVRLLRLPAGQDGLEVVVQRVGFLGTRRLLRSSSRDMTIDVALAPLSASLDTVLVSDRSRQLAAQPVIRGDEIASSTRGVFDLIDVLRKLRAQLLAHIGDDAKYKCQSSEHTGPFRTYVNERAIPYFPETFDELLHDVKSEAIDELRYVSCFDKSLSNDDYPSVGHLYITLRKGYAYNIKLGTYKESARAERMATAPDTTVLHADHARLVGVFDVTDGTPIEGADVIDILTGYSARTTRTGTVVLAFVSPTGTLLKIQRTGYVPFTSPVTNGPTDAPLTVTLTPRGRAEPRLARVPNPADTVRKLIVSGFYERRDTMPVPAEAILGTSRVAALARLSDAAAAMKRALCLENLFVDGARVAVVGELDSMISASWIVGIETYLGAEVSESFAPKSATNPRCVSLIWTR
ncbi:MAG TPA: carboxypeptidase-like regulatory domain-containing protein [Gemmatimonadaceae bacterium]|nr:carboxypeptidase-like regulatory domain-containing protein [Gemmatimonadaceae bacterium]